MKILITGGAGFIGSHLADELLEHGHQVRVLDCLSAQVHGPSPTRPAYLHEQVELLQGDVRDPEAVARALRGVDVVYHFAAAVGVGQSMYQIQEYTSVNNLGTAVLLEALSNSPVERLVVASSMSLYGEGAYCDAGGQACRARPRSIEQMKQGQWDPVGEQGQPLTPLPTPEGKQPEPSSIYALSKYDQEVMCLVVGQAYHIPTVALRFFNVYGPRQALSNPYTGVLAIFASRYLNRKPPLIFEDGWQRRDFVSVHDIARGCRLAMEVAAAAGEVFNLGSGQAYTVRQIAEELSEVMGMRHLQPEITRQYRSGDIRHCFADISKAERILGYEPQVKLSDGLAELADWLGGQQAQDQTESARRELAERGLAV